MTRLISKLLVMGAIFSGFALAVASGLTVGTTNLPELPTSTVQNNLQMQESNDENLVVELKDWQETRLPAKASNVVPSKKKKK